MVPFFTIYLTLLRIGTPGLLYPPNQFTRAEPIVPRERLGNPNLPHVTIIWIIVRIQPPLEVLLSIGHNMYLMRFYELCRQSKTRRIRNDLGDIFARLHFGTSLIVRHNWQSLVAARVCITNDADVEPISVLERIPKQRLVPNVAQIVHTVTIHVLTHRQQRHVEIGTQICKYRNVIHHDQQQYR